ncbi:MAG: hypothetical protein ABI321_14845 [Polyangia bacterium]
MKKLSRAKRARRATHEAPPQAEPSARALRIAGKHKVPPGAQLGPNRTIEAPQAPGPDSSPPRETVRATELQHPSDRQRDARPPYPTGYDPGRNMQSTQGFSPSSDSVVP